MPCPRQTAVLRLITLWATRSAEDDAFAYRIGLGDVLQDDVIDIVAAGDLFADLDAPAEQPAPYDRETQRRHELIEVERREDWGPSELDASGHRAPSAFAGSLTYQLAFEFGDGGEHGDQQASLYIYTEVAS